MRVNLSILMLASAFVMLVCAPAIHAQTDEIDAKNLLKLNLE